MQNKYHYTKLYKTLKVLFDIKFHMKLFKLQIKKLLGRWIKLRNIQKSIFGIVFVSFGIFLKISKFNWPGLGRDGSDGRNGSDGPQPWPIEIWNFKILSGVVRKRSESAPKSSKTVRSDPETIQKQSENDPKPSENDPKLFETIRKPFETVRNHPRPSENGPKPSETVPNGPKAFSAIDVLCT